MASQPQQPGRRRRVDPDRRERIARAALEVVAAEGVEALTHRAAAERADVPLGSTTYHFDDREELLLAALEEALIDDRRVLESWLEELPAEPDLPRALTDLIVASTGVDRESAMVGYELYAAAMRHPRLRPAAAEWARLMPELLERFVDATTAYALSVALEALLLRGLIGDAPFDRGVAEAVLRRVLADK